MVTSKHNTASVPISNKNSAAAGHLMRPKPGNDNILTSELAAVKARQPATVIASPAPQHDAPFADPKGLGMGEAVGFAFERPLGAGVCVMCTVGILGRLIAEHGTVLAGDCLRARVYVLFSKTHR